MFADSPWWDMLEGGTLVVACSGGMDSVGLALAAHLLLTDDSFTQRFTSRPALVLWHLDHGLREDSSRDRQFVEQLGRQLGVRVVSEKAALLGKEGNTEENARDERYSRLEALLCRSGADALAKPAFAVTAHHQGDQAETVLHHIIRGTHLSGLRGISSSTPAGVHRPWLSLAQGEIKAFVEAQGASWRDDPTNTDTTLTRNYLRHEIIPRLKQINPSAEAHIARLAVSAKAAQGLFESQLDSLEVLEFSKRRVDKWLPLVSWPAGEYHAFRVDGGWPSPDSVAGFATRWLQTECGQLSGAEHRALSEWDGFGGERLTLKGYKLRLPHSNVLTIQTPLKETIDRPGQELKPGMHSSLGGLEVEVRIPRSEFWQRHRSRDREPWEVIRSWPTVIDLLTNSPPKFPSWVCFLPQGTVFPLYLRDWREGDKLALSSGGSKKVGDVFTDAKVPACFRQVWAVLADNQDRVLWVPGLADSAQMQIAKNELPGYSVILRETG